MQIQTDHLDTTNPRIATHYPDGWRAQTKAEVLAYLNIHARLLGDNRPAMRWLKDDLLELAALVQRHLDNEELHTDEELREIITELYGARCHSNVDTVRLLKIAERFGCRVYADRWDLDDVVLHRPGAGARRLFVWVAKRGDGWRVRNTKYLTAAPLAQGNGCTTLRDALTRLCA